MDLLLRYVGMLTGPQLVQICFVPLFHRCPRTHRKLAYNSHDRLCLKDRNTSDIRNPLSQHLFGSLSSDLRKSLTSRRKWKTRDDLVRSQERSRSRPKSSPNSVAAVEPNVHPRRTNQRGSVEIRVESPELNTESSLRPTATVLPFATRRLSNLGQRSRLSRTGWSGPRKSREP